MNIPFVASTVLFNLLIAGIFVAEKQKMCAMGCLIFLMRV